MKLRAHSKFQLCRTPYYRRLRKCRRKRQSNDGPMNTGHRDFGPWPGAPSWRGRCPESAYAFYRPSPCGCGLYADGRRKTARDRDAGPRNGTARVAPRSPHSWEAFRTEQYSIRRGAAPSSSWLARPPSWQHLARLAAASVAAYRARGGGAVCDDCDVPLHPAAMLGIAPGPPGRGSTPRVFHWAPLARISRSMQGAAAHVAAASAASAAAPAAASAASNRSTRCFSASPAVARWGSGSSRPPTPVSAADALAAALEVRAAFKVPPPSIPPDMDPELALVLLDEDNLCEVRAEKEVQSWVELEAQRVRRRRDPAVTSSRAAITAKKASRTAVCVSKKASAAALSSSSFSSADLPCLLMRTKTRTKRRWRGAIDGAGRRGRRAVIRYDTQAHACAHDLAHDTGRRARGDAPEMALKAKDAAEEAGEEEEEKEEQGQELLADHPSLRPLQVDVCCSERRQLFLEISHARVCRRHPGAPPSFRTLSTVKSATDESAVTMAEAAAAEAAAQGSVAACASAPHLGRSSATADVAAAGGENSADAKGGGVPFTVTRPGDGRSVRGGHARRRMRPQKCGPGRARSRRIASKTVAVDLLPMEPVICSSTEFDVKPTSSPHLDSNIMQEKHELGVDTTKNNARQKSSTKKKK